MTIDIRIRFWMLVVVSILATMIMLARPFVKEGFSNNEETIFVSVASYRDSECMTTIKDMFAKAKLPGRIYVGICEQNTSKENEQCVPIEFEYHDNVRKISIPNGEAQGPCYARYLCSTLYRDESYFLQIDSHSTFVENWDVKAIEALKSCPSERAIISGYPHDDNVYDIDETSIPVLCDSKWNKDGLPQLNAIIKNVKDFKGKPSPIPFASGGFLFSIGRLLRDVPYDPNLPHLFQGEEILYSIRAWTSGYDIFVAPVNIVLHRYYRKEEPKFWNDIKAWHGSQKKSAARARRILALENPIIKPGSDPYGLGSVRTLRDYWTFSGLDPVKKTSLSKQKFCETRK